ncbi:hypothetical protein Tco_1286776, partial [Tanacetum coccineum]
LGWHLKEIHVTWTQFRKKRRRFQLYMKIDIKRAYSAWRQRRDFLRWRQKAQTTASGNFETTSKVTGLKKPVEDSARRRHSLDLNVENRERMRLRLFQFSLRDQASNWLERLLAGSIST